MLLKEGVVSEQLCRHAINPWPSWEPLVQKVDALQREFPIASGDVRRAECCFARAIVSNGLQMDPSENDYR